MSIRTLMPAISTGKNAGGFDQAGNRQWRQNLAGISGHDEYYNYDGDNVRKVSHILGGV
jgi:hypothetical protein